MIGQLQAGLEGISIVANSLNRLDPRGRSRENILNFRHLLLVYPRIYMPSRSRSHNHPSLSLYPPDEAPHRPAPARSSPHPLPIISIVYWRLKIQHKIDSSVLLGSRQTADNGQTHLIQMMQTDSRLPWKANA